MITFRPTLFAGVLVVAAACSTDPQYIQTDQFIEVGIPDSDITFASIEFDLPIRLELEEELLERQALIAELGGVQVPYVRRGDLSVEVEWMIRNVSGADGTARVHLVGGNEFFYYVPQNFVIDPEEDEEPPPLAGDIPITVAAGATATGVLREDQLYEAALDLDLITRGGLNPFAAIYQAHDDTVEFADSASGAVIPEAAFAGLVRYNIGLEADRHMILEFTVRVRDYRDLLHDLLLDAPAAELTVFNPQEFVPPPPPP